MVSVPNLMNLLEKRNETEVLKKEEVSQMDFGMKRWMLSEREKESPQIFFLEITKVRSPKYASVH